jgi:hypothetical protein
VRGTKEGQSEQTVLADRRRLPFCVTCPNRQNQEFVFIAKPKSLIDSLVAGKGLSELKYAKIQILADSREQIAPDGTHGSTFNFQSPKIVHVDIRPAGRLLFI